MENISKQSITIHFKQVKTFCFVGIFENELAIIDARPHMISNLDKIRDLLEIISTDLGVTDPVSGLTID